MTDDDLLEGESLESQIETLTSQIAILEKLHLAWDADHDYPDSTVSSKLIFHYQKIRKDLEVVELEPSDELITAMLTALNTILNTLKVRKVTLVEEFEDL